MKRAKRWISYITPQSPSPSSHSDKEAGFFSHAQEFTITGGQFLGVTNNYVSNGEPVFKLLRPYACLDATKDSSARYPPPKCHPETRTKIRDNLMQWLLDEYAKWKMLWVRGSAGTGKSAVAQSFGDSCEEKKMHGASYFFSRPSGRNKVETVVPTIVHQLATTIPKYRNLIGHKLANDDFLLQKALPVQFRELIIEPFATLQREEPQKPVVIILDGLDECDSEKAQRELLEMITNAIRTNPDLPLRWLIFSRPEAHLKNAFSRNSECGREELIIDDECRENVERHVRDRLTEIKATYNDIVPAEWPLPNELQELLDAVSGLFVFASTCLNYIDDPGEADPRSQLDSLLTFMRRSEGVMSRNPLAALDLLYSRILDDISPTVFKATRRILAYMSHRDIIDRSPFLNSAQALSNFLRFDQPTFYKAVRGLHSVMYIPDPKDAAKSELKFHHASFLDFLLDPHRSGNFVISQQEALADFVRSYIYWYEVDVRHFHTDDGWEFDRKHIHDSLPGLTWVSEDNRQGLSRSITSFLASGLFRMRYQTRVRLDDTDEDLSSEISNCDFRYWYPRDVFDLVRLRRSDPSTSAVRIEPSSPMDHRLLEYFNLVIGNNIARPAVFPLRRRYPRDRWIREYFFVGHGVKSVIVWRTESFVSQQIYFLRCDQEPSKAQISKYQELLRAIGWNEERVNLESNKYGDKIGPGIIITSI